MPVIQKRTAGVRAELAGLRQTHRQQAVALRALAASKTELADRRDELTRLENEGRIHARELMRSARLEADRALGLGEKERDIVDLMDALEARSEDRRAGHGGVGTGECPGWPDHKQQKTK